MVPRRALLRALGLSVTTGLAGCNALTRDEVDKTPTETPTVTATPTATPTTTLPPTTDSETVITTTTPTPTPQLTEDSRTAILTPTPDGTVDEFGRVVALSEDTAIVHAESYGAYVFENDSNWSLMTVLTPDDEEDFGGHNVSAAIVGEEAVLGGANAGSEGGAVYLFEQVNNQWRQRHQFIPNEDRDEFGRSVAFDGDRVVVGDNNDPMTMRSWSGNAYVFGRNETNWTEEAALGSDAENLFGTAVVIAGDTVLVGAPYAKPDSEETGAVYSYELVDGGWQRQTTLAPENSTNDSLFGQSVALDGDTAVIGAPGGEGGSAYVFEHIENEWTRRARITAPESDSEDDFGWSVAYTEGITVIGAPKAGQTGHAYVFREGKDWMEPRQLVSEDPPENAEFGFAVAIHGTTALVGSPVFREASPAHLFEL